MVMTMIPHIIIKIVCKSIIEREKSKERKCEQQIYITLNE